MCDTAAWFHSDGENWASHGLTSSEGPTWVGDLMSASILSVVIVFFSMHSDSSLSASWQTLRTTAQS